MIEHYYAVIMAGGGGTRLWPLSRQQKPKQMLTLFDDRSLFQTSVQRLDGAFPPERIFVVTVQEQVQALQAQCPEIPEQNYIIEPLPRGTASVVGLAAIALSSFDPQAVMAVLTADHFIKNEDQFRELLYVAHDVAMDGFLVTMGIQPTFPATGFGYVQTGELIGKYRGHDAFKVLSFKEKPNENLAQEFVRDGDHLWNSGMFFWRVSRILEEFDRQMPDLASSLKVIGSNWDESRRTQILNRVWPDIKPETIDYGIMEHAQRVAVVPAVGLGWSDVGSWDSLIDLLDGDADGNVVMSDKYIGLETSESLIYSKQPQRLIVTIGVDNLVIVDTGDVLLVCNRDQAQKVRTIVHQLKQEGKNYT